MKISGIDRGFINIIDYLNKNGFYTFSSCDGIVANHLDINPVNLAYISFLKSSKIIDLMGAFLRDERTFNIKLSNNSHSEPYNLYDNLIEGNTYSVYFDNKQGHVTNYFERIIIGVTEGNIVISDSEKQDLIALNDILEDSKDSDLNFNVNFNSEYQPYMNKSGRINYLKILTRDGYGYSRNMNELVSIVSKKFNIKRKYNDFNEIFDEDEFVISSNNNSECTIYFNDSHIKQMLEQVEYIKGIGNSLSKVELKESDFDFPFDDEYEQEI